MFANQQKRSNRVSICVIINFLIYPSGEYSILRMETYASQLTFTITDTVLVDITYAYITYKCSYQSKQIIDTIITATSFRISGHTYQRTLIAQSGSSLFNRARMHLYTERGPILRCPFWRKQMNSWTEACARTRTTDLCIYRGSRARAGVDRMFHGPDF